MANYGPGDGYNSGRNDLTIGDYANGMPSIRISQIPASFARQIPWMLPAMGIMVAGSWFLTKDIKRNYVADGRVLVQLGSEHVYNPAAGSTNSGLTITPDQVVQTEVDIIKNSAILETVIHRMISSDLGGERFAPKAYMKWVNAAPEDKTDRWNDLIKMVDRSYAVMPKPKSSIVNLQYKHVDGDIAVRTLDAFIEEYEIFRKDKFVSETSGQVSERRIATEQQLKKVDRQIQAILDKNSISDFGTEQDGARKRAEDQRAELNALHGQISAVEAALASTEDRLRQTPATIDLYVDDRASQRLAQAELEKRQLLAKYLPASRAVRQKEAEIAEIRSQISANGGRPAGGRRVGPNTVHQALLTQRNGYQAQADSLREREIVLTSTLNAAVSKVRRLRDLSPTYASLERERTTLEERLRGLNAKEQESLVNQAAQEASSENIKVITRPTTPRKDRNMKKIMFALMSAGSIFTILMLGLLRVFLDPKLYGPGSQPGSRRRKTDRVYDDVYQRIPDPVPDYTPYQPQPAAPAYAPAAAQAAETMPDAYTANYQPQPVFDSGALFNEQAGAIQSAAPQYASNPYAPAQSRPATAGVGGTVPILGSFGGPSTPTAGAA